MPVDMTIYFDVIKQMQAQVNRITYAIGPSEQDRLNQLNRLEHEINQKFNWARRRLTHQEEIQAEVAENVS